MATKDRLQKWSDAAGRPIDTSIAEEDDGIVIGRPIKAGLYSHALNIESLTELRATIGEVYAKGTTKKPGYANLLGGAAVNDGLEGGFQWTTDITSTDDGITVIVPTVAGWVRTGCWKRRSQKARLVATQHEWYVNGVTGSDNNDGATSGRPLKTLAELSRRFDRLYFKNHVVVFLVDSQFADEELDIDIVGDFNKFCQFRAFHTPVTLGNTTFVRNRNPALGHDTQVQVAGVTDWVPYINKFIYQHPGNDNNQFTAAVVKYAKLSDLTTAGTNPPSYSFINTGIQQFPQAERNFQTGVPMLVAERTDVRRIRLWSNMGHVELIGFRVLSDHTGVPLHTNNVYECPVLTMVGCHFVGDAVWQIDHMFRGNVNLRNCSANNGQVNFYGEVLYLTFCTFNGSTPIFNNDFEVQLQGCFSMNEVNNVGYATNIPTSWGTPDDLLARIQVNTHIAATEAVCDLEFTNLQHPMIILGDSSKFYLGRGKIYGHDNNTSAVVVEFRAANAHVFFGEAQLGTRMGMDIGVATSNVDDPQGYAGPVAQHINGHIGALCGYIDRYGNRVVGPAGDTGGEVIWATNGDIPNISDRVLVRVNNGTLERANDTTNGNAETIGVCAAYGEQPSVYLSGIYYTYASVIFSATSETITPGPIWLGANGLPTQRRYGLLSKRPLGWVLNKPYVYGSETFYPLKIEVGKPAFDLERVVYETNTIDLKTAGNTTVVPAGAASTGKKFVVFSVWFECESQTGGAVTIQPVINIGTNAASYNNIVASQTLPSIATDGTANVSLAASQTKLSLVTTPIVLNIATAAVGPTTWTGKFFIEGRWI